MPRIDSPLVVLLCSNVYPLFNPAISVQIGGMETRAALFGRELATTGNWSVHFVVGDFGQDFVTHHENVTFHIYQPTYRRAGRNVFPRLRDGRRYPRLCGDRRDFDLVWQVPLISAWLALPAVFFPRFWRDLRPDVVCCFGNSALSAEVIADCSRLGIPTILFIASDIDLSSDYVARNGTRNDYRMAKWKGHYSLVTADHIVVQSENQRDALLRRFNRSGVLIRNPVQVTPNDAERWLPRDKREFVLWIGRSDSFHKRPFLFLQLAQLCPELTFLMIVNNTNADIFNALRAQSPNNLTIVEEVPHSDIWGYYRRARVFVSTSVSSQEGFPNTFLQSAVMGVPIVSLEVDPDGMLSGHACGICVGGDGAAMRTAVLQLWSDIGKAETLAMACHHYVLARHQVAGRVVELEKCLCEASAAPRARPLPWWTLARRFSGRRARRSAPATKYHGREKT